MNALAIILLCCSSVPQKAVHSYDMRCTDAVGKEINCLILQERLIEKVQKDIAALTEVNRVLMDQVADLQRQINEMAQSVDDNRNRISVLEARQ